MWYRQTSFLCQLYVLAFARHESITVDYCNEVYSYIMTDFDVPALEYEFYLAAFAIIVVFVELWLTINTDYFTTVVNGIKFDFLGLRT